MEPTDLTCGKCGKSWKLIKAGSGAVTCPHCKEPLNAAPVAAKTEPPVASATIPASDPARAPETPPQPPPLMGLTPVSLFSDRDTDDPALQADYDDRFDKHRRSGSHPLAKVIVILLLVFIGLPVAVFILLLIVCAVLVAAR
jgi:hypothetical protein